MDATAGTTDKRSAVAEVLAATARTVRERPSFGLYLVALALFPFKWLSPFSHAQAGWIDVFFAASAAAWALEAMARRRSLHLRAPHYWGAAYLAAGVLSAMVASTDPGVGAANVVIMAELVVIALLTSDYARESDRRRSMVLVILIVTFVIGAQSVLALTLFYLDIGTSLEGRYGALLPSHQYTRVAGGFYSAPLLGSFCIFASAMLALDEGRLARSVRMAGQVVLAVVVVLTGSRAAIGFALAAIIRTAYARGSTAARRVAVACAIGSVIVMAGLTVGELEGDPTKPASWEFEPYEKESSNRRLQQVTTSFDTLTRHPVLGSGPGSLTGEVASAPSRAHFTPLNVAATIGLPSLAALTLLLIALWRQRRRPTNVAIWSGLAALGVDGLGQDIEHFRHVWVMLGMADADRSEGRQTSASRPSGAAS
jgi:hypothetical protein